MPSVQRRSLVNYTPVFLVVLLFTAIVVHGTYSVEHLRMRPMMTSLVVIAVFLGSSIVSRKLLVAANSAPGQDDKDSSPTLMHIMSLGICLICDASVAYKFICLTASIPEFILDKYPTGTFLTYMMCSSYIVIAYLRCCECWYEKATISHGSFNVSYGSMVLLSVPVLKVFGHCVLVIRNRKYELRLDKSTSNQPTFNERDLLPGEAEELQRQLGHRWFILGETKMTDAEVKDTFSDVIGKFGGYDPVSNNCRHFVKRGCDRILLESPAKLTHEEFLGAIEPLSYLEMVWSTLRMDFYHRLWAALYGRPDWKQITDPSRAEFKFLKFLREVGRRRNLSLLHPRTLRICLMLSFSGFLISFIVKLLSSSRWSEILAFSSEVLAIVTGGLSGANPEKKSH